MGPEDGEDRPMLRVVTDEEAPPPRPRSFGWSARRIAIGALALAAIAGAVVIGVAIGHGASADGHRTASATTTTSDPTSTTLDVAALPTITPVPTITVPGPTAVAATTAGATASPTLVPLPVAGATGGIAPPPVAAPTASAPTTGSVRVRLFNGFTPGQSLQVWEVSSTPVLYGTLPYGGYAQVDAHGALLNAGVTLQLRFVLPGGDPTAAKASSTSGPWSWDLVPTAGSAQTLVLVNNAGLRVVRIDDRRATSAVRTGTVHIVPIARHLVLAGSRTLRWGHQPAGCLGPTTTDNSEFDVPLGTGLELFAGSDPSCAAPLSDPVTLTRSTAVAVIGLDAGADRANLVTLPLG